MAGTFLRATLGALALFAVSSPVYGFHLHPTKIVSFLDKRQQEPVHVPGARAVLGPEEWIPRTLACAGLAGLLTFPHICSAVSGGGLDYANLDITGQDFSNSNYKGKDFTQVIAKGTSFMKSNLQGCRFYKAYLVNADFSNADIRGASLEDTSMDGANLKNALAGGAYFSASILDAGDLSGTDFTDAQLPLKTIPLVCERSDVQTGKNPVTGVSTAESLMCP